MDKDKNEKEEKENGSLSTALSTLARVSQLGFIFVFSILISVGIGYWLENVLETGAAFK